MERNKLERDMEEVGIKTIENVAFDSKEYKNSEEFNPQYEIQDEQFYSMKCRCSCAPSPGPYCNIK